MRAECHTPTFGESAGGLLRVARRRIEDLTGVPPICPDSPEAGNTTGTLWPQGQMAAFLLCTPERSGVESRVGLPACDSAALQRRLYDEYRVEVLVIEWTGRQSTLGTVAPGVQHMRGH